MSTTLCENPVCENLLIAISTRTNTRYLDKIALLTIKTTGMKFGILKMSLLAMLLFSFVILAGCPGGAKKIPGGGSNDTSTAPIKPVRE